MSEQGPTVESLKFVLSETWVMVVTCTNGDGDVLDLSGALEARFRLANSDGLWLDLAEGTGVEIDSDPTTGVLIITVTPEMQQDILAAGTYNYEVRVKTADGITSTQLVGTITVISSLFSRFITRACIASAVGAAGVAATGVAA